MAQFWQIMVMTKRQSDADHTWWGVIVELYRGHGRENHYQNDFNQWGIQIIGGKQITGSIFMDGMVGYGELSQNYTIHGALSDLSGKMKTISLQPESGADGCYRLKLLI